MAGLYLGPLTLDEPLRPAEIFARVDPLFHKKVFYCRDARADSLGIMMRSGMSLPAFYKASPPVSPVRILTALPRS